MVITRLVGPGMDPCGVGCDVWEGGVKYYMRAYLEHDVLVVDLTVVGESTQGGDVLGGDVNGGGGVTLVGLSSGLTDLVDLLVQLGTVVETVLTRAGHRVRDTGRMPCSNAGNLAQTSVRLTGQTGHTPTVHNTLESVTTGHGDHVAVLGVLEDLANRHALLKELLGEGELSLHVSSVHLDLADVGLALAELQLAGLGVDEHTEHGRVLGEAGQLLLAVLTVSLEVGGVLGEGLLLRCVPSTVVATEEGLSELLCPHGGHSAHSAGRGLVSDDTDNHHLGAVKDGHGLADLLLVHLGSGTVQVTHNVGHTRLVGHEGGQVGLLGLVILGEGPDATTDVGAPLAGKVSQMAVTRLLKLTVGHFVERF